MNVAPVWSENELSNVATSDAFANIRAAALYGGGLALDTPPEFVFNLAAGDPAYIPALEALLKWCTANGLRSSMILSPDGGAGVDPNLLANTQKLVAMLQSAGAMPSQFIVENYSQTAAAVGDYFSTASANSLNAAAKMARHRADGLDRLGIRPGSGRPRGRRRHHDRRAAGRNGRWCHRPAALPGDPDLHAVGGDHTDRDDHDRRRRSRPVAGLGRRDGFRRRHAG